MNKRVSPWAITSMLLIALMLYAMNFLIIVSPSVMMDHIQHVYGVNDTALGWLSTYYFIAYTPMVLFAGIILDFYGTRRSLFYALILCALGSALFGLEVSFYLALVGRFLIGLGAAFAFVAILKLANDWLPYRYFAVISGIATAVGMSGAIGGQVMLSHAFERFGYIAVHHTITAILGILAILSLVVIKDQDHGINRTKQNIKQLSIWTQFSLMTSRLMIIIKRPQILLNGIIGFLMYFPTAVFASLWGVDFFLKIYHLSLHEATVMDAYIFSGWIIGGPFIGYFSNSLGKRKLPLQIGSIGLVVSFVLLLSHITDHVLWLRLLCLAIGIFSTAEVLAFAVANDITENEYAGTAASVTNMFISLSGVCQPIIPSLKHFFASIWSDQNDIILLAYACIPLLLTLSCVLITQLKETHCIPHQASI